MRQSGFRDCIDAFEFKNESQSLSGTSNFVNSLNSNDYTTNQNNERVQESHSKSGR